MTRFSHPDAVTSYIDGAFLPPARDAHPIPVVNPGTGACIATLYEAGPAEVDRAVQAAARSFEAGTWHGLPLEQRVATLRRIAALTAEHADELCWLESIDLGIPIAHGRGAVTARVIRNFNFYADHLSQAVERAARLDDLYQRYVHRDPVGVCALISPWNAPLMLATSKMAPALAFGNSCVIKTSEYTPLALARFMTMLTEAGVPPGVVNLVNGRGPVTGSALVAHPRVDVVSFTGGGQAGRAIAAAAGADLKRCDLELGGKSASIVSDSADLDLALEGTLLGIFANAGQICFAGSRILVQRDIADVFIERFVARARQIRVGDPLDPRTEMGPVAYEAHFRRVLDSIAPASDMTVLSGGHAIERPGYFIEPTVLLAHSADARACQEEIFGPVATFMVYDTFDEALAIANRTRYGLAAYLWSNRLDESMAAAQRLRAGTLMVNSPMVLDLRMPFGGYKESGIGREGIESLRNFYSEEKAVAIATRLTPMPMRLGLGAGQSVR
ncbi:aldehyde dehydrogenase family protein [Cupriavidus basilensis]|uniref:aldehyde dehydrogenase family protein n=1 Tax=Cupriavidus basilensis TaxID=68895 RepID=UPI0020A63C88|nr:aldehyde dehydrogenase family protein [Cupriavidus basilensis]MCP3024096.1 aldehyde dehydrogenase family protein [Cupriavidus basilensis]